jgi:hypothetical protein
MPLVPSFEELTWPTLQALRTMGGSGTNKELLSKIIELERIPLEVQSARHTDHRQTKLNYNLGRTKTLLKKAGAIDNSSWGVWSITAFGEGLAETDVRLILSRVRKQRIVDRFGGIILRDDESRTRLAEADRDILSRRIFKHPGGFYLVAERDGTVTRFESIESARGWAYSLPVGMVDEGYSAPGPPRAIVEQLPHTPPMAKRPRWKYAMLGVFAAGVIVLLSWGVYYDITVLQPAWETQEKIQRDKEKATLEEQQIKKDQEDLEWAHCVDSKGSDPICEKVCIRFDYKPGFMALSGVDCRKFGIISKDQDKEEAGFCVGSKGSDPICHKVCINHGQHGELGPLGVDCTKFEVTVDNRLPFEKRIDEEERNFGRAVALCALGSNAACEYRRGDPWPPRP